MKNFRYSICLICLLASSGIVAQNLEDIDEYARSVEFSQDYVAVANTLAEPYTNQVHQARAIFTWIVHNFSYDQRLKEQVLENSITRITGESKEDVERQKLERIDKMVERMLKRKKGICQDYSHLFKKMCGVIGIEAEFVTGFGRFGPENIGRNFRRGNHAWNAVKLNEEWQLVDVTWTDGMDFGEQDFGEGFWLIEPELFILSHFPDDKEWQLLSEPLSKSEFAELPYMHGGYLKYKIKSITPNDGFVKAGSKITFNIEGDIDGFPLMLVKNNAAQRATFEKIDDYYNLQVDLKGARGIVHIGVLNTEMKRVEPLISMKVR